MVIRPDMVVRSVGDPLRPRLRPRNRNMNLLTVRLRCQEGVTHCQVGSPCPGREMWFTSHGKGFRHPAARTVRVSGAAAACEVYTSDPLL